MELKQYQQDTLNDLAAFMEQVAKDNNLSKAYANFWLKKGVDISCIGGNRFIHSYDNSTVPGVPRVMFKVPTAGGKTFIASNALKVIFDHLPNEHPKVVTWFVPSDTILKQTYRNLSNPQHPYRQRINTHFNNRVVIVDKETALAGTGIQPDQIQEQLTIFVLSVQSFIPTKNNKEELTNEGLRSLRENTNLTAYAKMVNEYNKVQNADETSLLQAIACLNPVVIVDESHNFGSDMRIDALTQINPCFILDLTATPREKSNIISFVDAKKLKDANMVKLPVVLYNRDSTEDVLVDAIQLRRSLEHRATIQRQNGGRYIRPIVLFQAQPKSDSDNETFDKVKEKLVTAGIPEEHIKIKIANKDELQGVDLKSEDCPVRYIITINALKEGWDCPFAYILASLANKTSKIDVEQIVGRVLRLPYATRHADKFLNLSYVFTSSNEFRQTIDSVIKGLNNAGFSSKDTRVVENAETVQELREQQIDIFNGYTGNISETDDNTFDESVIRTRLTIPSFSSNIEEDDAYSTKPYYESESVSTILKGAMDADREYEETLLSIGESNIPSDIKDNVNIYIIKEVFFGVAAEMKLPVFVMKVQTDSLFAHEGENVKLTKTMLTDGFLLENADKNIDFETISQEAVQIDLEERNKGEFVPKKYQMTEVQLHEVRELFAGYNEESKRNQLTSKIAKRLHFDEVNEPHISNYIKSVLKDKSGEELMDLFNKDIVVERAFKQKIDSLVAEYQKKNFKTLMDKGKILCEPQYLFPKELTLYKRAIGLSKGLYTEEGDMNNFEYDVISAVANLDNVLFWHRNPERGQGFCINGFINHYPDFIIRTKTGKVVLLETKGDDRDNTDSRMKLDLGITWANKAGDLYRYFMVFDQTRFEGAYTKDEFISVLKEL